MADDREYADALPQGRARGRGAGLNPGNRFERVRLHVLGEHLDSIAAEPTFDAGRGRSVPTQVFRDRTRTIINHVDSPDLPFNWTINPYRGCEHGCAYCYARPDHERLGFSSGLDFETKILAKPDAPKLLRRELAQHRWRAETIVMCGDTDCYQPIEAKLRITRGCLEVMAEARQPVGIVTKNRLVTRDVDMLGELASHGAVRVSISLTTLDRSLAAKMEPRASAPADRLRAVSDLADAGVPVAVMVAPIVPGLTDREVPAILRAAADAGANSAGYILLRLPHQNRTLFVDWLEHHFPARASRVISLVRQTRGGEMYDCAFGSRHRGAGPVAEQIRAVFDVFARRCGLDRPMRELSGAAFRPPQVNGQLTLF